MLHGRGADEADLIGIVEALDPRLAVVSVRAPLRWGPGFAWYGAGPNEADTMRASLAEGAAWSASCRAISASRSAPCSNRASTRPAVAAMSGGRPFLAGMPNCEAIHLSMQSRFYGPAAP